MGLFRRRSRSDAATAAAQVTAITEFWSWWQATGSEQVARAIADGTAESVSSLIDERVKGIDPGLSWELGPGTWPSRHRLMVTPEGNPALRATAHRWLRAAPAAGEVWCYADSRQPLSDLEGTTLQVDGVRITPSEVQVAARVNGPALDVTVYHPAFADLADAQRAQASFLVLDWVLGETVTETWLGEITTTPVVPLDPVPVAGLPAVIEQLRDQYTDAAGNPVWAMLTGTADDGLPVVAMAQVPLRPAVAPHLDTCVQILVWFRDRTPEGLPQPECLEDLRAFEEHLRARLGGSGRLLAQQTHAGVRQLLYYIDRTTPAAGQLEAATTGWTRGNVTVGVQYDPSWQMVAHLRG